MAKKYTSTKKPMKRKSSSRKKRNQANVTLIVMLVIIFVIIGIFAVKALNKDESVFGDNTTTTESSYDGSDYWSGSDSGEEDEQSITDLSDDEVTTEEQSSEGVSTTKEATTEMMTLPINNEPQSNIDVILSHYTDYMGFPENSLFIKGSESEENARGYTYTLRVNLPGSPNKLIGDVFVEKGTGKVTDSMGNEPWYITD